MRRRAMVRRTFLLALLLAAAGGGSALFAQGGDLTTFHLMGNGPTTRCPFETSDPLAPLRPPFWHWDLRKFPGAVVPFQMSGVTTLGIPTAANVIAAVNRAVTTWNNVTPSHITLQNLGVPGPGQCPLGGNTMDQRNCITWDDNFPTGVAGAMTRTLANTVTGEIVAADIIFDGNLLWTHGTPAGPGPPYSIEAIALHELGHFLGLNHTDDRCVGVPASAPPDDAPGPASAVMFSTYQSGTNVVLKQGDRDGANFLYSADLGDLPPPYKTAIRSTANQLGTINDQPIFAPANGAGHLFGYFGGGTIPRYQYEWFGFSKGKIDDHPSEVDPRPADDFDDGVKISGKCKADGTLDGCLGVCVGVRTAADFRNRRHNYTNGTPMFINGFFDWNDDGSFAGPGEHAIGQTGTRYGGFSVTEQGCYGFCLHPPPGSKCKVKSRFRLDYREDVGEVARVDPILNLDGGFAQFGEVEDYIGHKITPPDFGGPRGGQGGPCGCEHDYKPVMYCHIGAIGVIVGGTDMDFLEICHPPEPYDGGSPLPKAFPLAGTDCMNSTLSIVIDFNKDGEADESLGLAGPVCVERSDPYIDPDTGLKAIDTKMVSLSMVGYSQVAGRIGVELARDKVSTGRILQSAEAAEVGVDSNGEYPADSYFDVYFTIEAAELGSSEIVGPVRVEAQIPAVPPGKVIEGTVLPAPVDPP